MDPMIKRNLIFLYFIELCAGSARGSYLVCMGWTTLIVSKDVAVVGQVFIVAMIASIVSGPIVGICIDRYSRKYLTIIAHLGISAALLSLGLAVALDSGVSIFWFFLTVVIVSICRNLYQGSHDGLLHANVDATDIVHIVARFRAVHLLTTASGTVLTGVIIEYLSPTAGFLLSALFSVCLVFSASFVRGVTSKKNTIGFSGFLQDFSSGLTLFRNNQALRYLTILAGVALPIGQLSNAILSSFIRDDLNRGSDVFGFVDAAWPVGGMVAAAVLSTGLRKITMPNMEFLFAALVGLSTIVFSFCTSIFSLSMMHAAMGFLVWMCRIIIDGRILQICTAYTVGRTKVYIDVMFSFMAMVMCLSPTLIKLPNTSSYFFYWGIFVVISSAMLWLRQVAEK